MTGDVADDEDHNVAPVPKDDHKDDPKDNPQVPMSTKKPPAVAKATTTKPAKVVISPPTKKIALYHLDMRDAAIVAYYSDGGVDYAKVEVHVNGGLPPGTYRFSLAKNGMTISFLRGIGAMCFETRQFWG